MKRITKRTNILPECWGNGQRSTDVEVDSSTKRPLSDAPRLSPISDMIYRIDSDIV